MLYNASLIEVADDVSPHGAMVDMQVGRYHWLIPDGRDDSANNFQSFLVS